MQRNSLPALVALLTCSLIALPAVGQVPDPIESSETAASAIDPVDLEAFLDGLIQARMDSFDVVGVTVSVVHQGEVVLAKGYGHADLEAGRLVRADETLFRPGSISKTFTWTAVMQLYEQGRLDLDTDINEYLEEVDVPDSFPEPITLRQLMAHTPGFEDSSLGHLFENEPNEVLALSDYLKTHQPARVRPPGVAPAYSNYGTGLAGQIVAEVSGERFEDYVERHILHPLGMESSTFREPWGDQLSDPMPERLVEQSSVGYRRKSGAFIPATFEFIAQVGPAGALSTTSADMARWMLMHLGEGSLDGVQILKPETARLMHSRHWAPDPVMTGLAHGFIESDVLGYRGYGHSGGTLYFLSDMVMIPELELGIFISSNTAGGGGKLMAELPALVVGRYFEDRAGAAPEPPGDFAERGQRYSGTYVFTRRPYTTVEKLLMLPQLAVRMAPTEDGYLLVQLGDQSQRWVEIAPLTFRQTEGSGVAKFLEDEDGNITGVPYFTPIMVLEKTSGRDDPNLLLGAIGLGQLVFAAALVGAWLRRKREIQQSPGEHWASVATLGMAAGWLAWVLVFGASALGMLDDLSAAMFTFPSSTFVASLTIAIAAAIATVAAALLLHPVWRRSSWSRWRRIRHTLVVLLGLATLLALNDLNAIGYHYF